MAKKVSVASIRKLAKEFGMNEVKTVDINGLEVEIKQYLPIKEKREIALLVSENAFIGQSDLKWYDKAVAEVMFGTLIIDRYTNINVMQDYFEFYDCVKSSGLLDIVLEYIGKDEIDEIVKLVDSRKEDNFRTQELRGMMGYKLERLFSVVNDKLSDVEQVISNFDPAVLKDLGLFADIENNKIDTDVSANVQEKEEDIKEKIKEVENKVLEMKPKE